MKYRTLPGTQLEVSEICLGTMTWGEQNSEAEAHAQLDYAVAQGINFIDTAEMYPVPPNAMTQGRTETFLGNWLARHLHDENGAAVQGERLRQRDCDGNRRVRAGRQVRLRAADTTHGSRHALTRAHSLSLHLY